MSARAVRGYIDMHGRESFLADLRHAISSSPDERAKASARFRATMNVAENDKGGALIPTGILEAFHETAGEFGVARRRAMSRLVATGQNTLPQVKPSRTFWSMRQNSALAIPTSNPSYRAANLALQPVAITLDCTHELFEDSDWLSTTLAELDDAAQELEDRLLFSRAGIGGLSGAGLVELLSTAGFAGSLATAAAGETTVAGLTAASVRGAIKKLPSRAFANARWYVNPAIGADLFLRLADPESATGDREEGLPIKCADDGTWFAGNLPVEWTSAMPSTGAAGDIIALCGDLRRAAALCSTGAMDVSVSRDTPETQPLLEVAVRGIHRVDVAFQDVGDATNAGAIVALRLAAA